MLHAEATLSTDDPENANVRVRCGSCNVNAKTAHKTMPQDCDKRFSLRLGTAMEASKLGYQIWAMTAYLMMTGIKGVSSMKLHQDFRDLAKKIIQRIDLGDS